MQPYQILPFRFKRFDDKVFVVNEVGEFIFLNKKDFDAFINYKLISSQDTFLDLKAKQLLTDTDIAPVIRMLSVKYRTKKGFLKHFTSLHMVVPTLRCNSKCLYCQVSSKQLSNKGFDMTEETAMRTVDVIFKSPSPMIKIEFQGGEPLLNMGILKYIVGYAEKINLKQKKRLEFVVCTNLSLVTTKMLKYFKKHNIYISTSLDGPEDLHNTNRPLQNGNESYAVVVENIKKAQNILGIDKVSALMTTTKGSLDRFSEIVDEYIAMGFNYIFFRALNPYGFAHRDKLIFEYSIEEYIEAYIKALEYIIDINMKGKYFVEGFAALLLTRILTPFSTGFVDMQSPSGAGISGALYNYDGNVYASDEGRMLASVGDHRFLLGNVINNTYKEIFYGNTIREIVNVSCLECLPNSSDCAYQTFCGSDPIRNYSETGEVIGNHIRGSLCRKNNAIISYLLTLIYKNDTQVMSTLWSWITHRSVNVENYI